MAVEKATDHSERDKARGKTPSQQEIAEYNRGDFQDTDPVTGEARGDKGGNWQDPDVPFVPIGEDAPEDSPDDDEPKARKAPKAPAKKAPARKAAKRSRRVIGEAPLRTDVE